jgi:hypothetical protein
MENKMNLPRKAKRIYRDLIVAAVFVFFALQPGGVFLAVLLFLPLAFFNLAQSVRHADARKKHLLLAGIWLSAFALVYGFHIYQDAYRRQQAGALVAKIQAYQERHGNCPPTLEAIGENREARLGRRSNYFCHEGYARLSYTVPSSGFDISSYDFEQKTWNFHPD